MKETVFLGFVAGLVGMVGVACAVEADPIAPGSWTMVLLPDTQFYSLTYPMIYQAQTAWIAAHKDTHNIKMVLHLGDITHTKTKAEFAVARTAMDALSTAGVPYSMCAGNHDYTLSTRATLFNDAAYFGPGSSYAVQPHFRGAAGGFHESGKTDNSWCTFGAGDQAWLVFSVEYGPRDGVVAWMNTVAAAHPHHNLILNTHAYLYYDGTRYDYATHGSTQSWSPHAHGNDGQELWDKLVKKHASWRFTFSGHAQENGTGWLGSVGGSGNVVHQILANYQMRSNGGDGYLRVLEFMADGDTVKISSYSPYQGAYLHSYDQSFTLSMSELPPEPRPVNLIRGVAAAAIDVADGTNVWTVVGTGPRPIAPMSPANLADVSLTAAGIPTYREQGVMMATVRQNARSGDHGTVEVSYRNYFALGPGDNILQVATSRAPGADDTNMNVAVAFFPFADGWIGGHVQRDGDLAEHHGVRQSNVTHPGTGRYQVSIDGINSQTDGMLFAVGAEDGYNFLSTAPLTSGAGWEVVTRDNTATVFQTLEDNRWSFVYVDHDTPGLTGGRVATNGTLIRSVGGASVARIGAGVYRITVPGYTPGQGVLLLTMTEYETSTITAPADDIISYEADGSAFLVNIRDRSPTGSDLQDGEFVFAFLPFDRTLTVPPSHGSSPSRDGDFERHRSGSVEKEATVP